MESASLIPSPPPWQQGHADLSKPSSSSVSWSSASPTSVESPSSIYVTFKVLQLVNGFRKRVTRKHIAQVSAKKVSAAVKEDFCQDFEREAFERIDQYLGRKPRHPSRKWPKGGKRTAIQTPPTDRSVDCLLQRLDPCVSFGKHAIKSVASSNRLFVERQTYFTVAQLSIQELCERLVIAKELLACLENRAASSDCAKSLCEGDEIPDFLVDDTLAANLEHLLLRLESELIRLLVAKLVGIVHQHISDCQKDQSKHAEDWFFEFPDARHPLSTTWPWSIKPSLAVLWGVCWMFYDRQTGAPRLFDSNFNLLKANGDIEVPAEIVRIWLAAQQLDQQQQQHMQAADPHRPSGDPNIARSAPLDFPISPNAMTQPLLQQPLPQVGTSLSHSINHHAHHRGIPEQAPHTTSGLGYPHTSNSPACATQPSAAYPVPAAASGYNFSLGFVQDNAYRPTAAGTWNQGFAAPYPHADGLTLPQQLPQTRPEETGFGGQAHLPQGSHHPRTPVIRLETEFPESSFQRPQEYNNYSATSTQSNSSRSYRNYHLPPTSDLLSPHSPFNMTDTMPPELQQQVRDIANTTPPRSPHELQMPMPEPTTRKRSHSQISNGPPFQPQPQQDVIHHQQDGSHHGGSQFGEEEYSHSPGRVQVQRPEPLMNEQKKYMCNFGGDECVHLLFDRKCEWSKHMDKHDRPYRCPDPGCAKLQGFTYSGGLLRHEREVHGKHGGPKAQLMCPHPDCKRHAGKGFTRKENLNEHVRRVHQGRYEPSHQQHREPSDQDLKHDPALDALAGAAQAINESTETPASGTVSEAVMIEQRLASPVPAPKRRRHAPPNGEGERSASEDVEDLRRQIEHLQQENMQKDERLFDMERMIAEMDRRFQEQQRAQNEWHEQQQQAQAAQAIATAAQQA